MNILSKISSFIGKTFSLWAALFAAAAFFAPDTFKWAGPYIPWLLGIIMFGMGLIVHKVLGSKTEKLTDALPLVSVAAIVLIIGAVVGASKGKIIESGLLIFAVVVLHNGIGYLLGFFAAKWTGLPYDAQKTLAIEVGMQNSGLGAALAAAHFAAAPVVAVPSALFSVWHNISGSLLATYWAAKASKHKKP